MIVSAEDKNNKLMSSEGMEAPEQELVSFAGDNDPLMDPGEPDDDQEVGFSAG